MDKFRFSVITPVYNVAAYLPDAVRSVTGQDIGFEDNIQIILVNDGSTDDSDSVCRAFAEEYPDNIVYIAKENGGVSSARNEGMKYAEGKYVNFLDGDDIWEKNVFGLVWDFFEKHEDEIDMVAGRQRYFEGKSGYTSLDYKFDGGDRVVDIFEEPTFGQYSVTSAFFKRAALEGEAFDTRLKYAEDARFITQILYKKNKYGVMKSAVHNFRKRGAGSSVTQNKSANESAYLDTANHYYQFMLDYSREVFGRVIPYAQYAVVNAIKYRVGIEIPEELPESIRVPYIEKISDLLGQIDDEVILTTPGVVTDTKLYMLKLKEGSAEKLAEHMSIDGGIVSYKGIKAGKAFSKKNLFIDEIAEEGGGKVLRGIIRTPLGLGIDDFYCQYKGSRTKLDVGAEVPDRARQSFSGEPMNRARSFTAACGRKFDLNKASFKAAAGDWEEELSINYEGRTVQGGLAGKIKNRIKNKRR